MCQAAFRGKQVLVMRYEDVQVWRGRKEGRARQAGGRQMAGGGGGGGGGDGGRVVGGVMGLSGVGGSAWCLKGRESNIAYTSHPLLNLSTWRDPAVPPPAPLTPTPAACPSRRPLLRGAARGEVCLPILEAGDPCKRGGSGGGDGGSSSVLVSVERPSPDVA
ncbi:hypothetical protein E2C01_020360 [Portunus trituberculatus]|uniref:Uncharacterized protein n=1 Tax=Portunus trituberculatus TaxID=210409 RepID=A0A5B7E2Y8_PORTR|nr:hypothetical protein [Portunus trituberculatus]